MVEIVPPSDLHQFEPDEVDTLEELYYDEDEIIVDVTTIRIRIEYQFSTIIIETEIPSVWWENFDEYSEEIIATIFED